MPKAGFLLAIATGIAMIFAGADPWLALGVVMVWLGSLWLSRPAPTFDTRRDKSLIASHEAVAPLIETLGLPLLILRGQRIVAANRAAREALGAHVVGQDARIALRHPEAMRLLEPDACESITIQGFVGGRSMWQLTRRRIDEDFWMIELVNRTAEADIGRAHTDFVANASHELSTPLASIIGYIETLAEAEGKVDADTSAKFQGIVLREARRLQSLVQDLMSLSRIEAEKHDRPRGRVDLGQLAASVAGDLSATSGDGRVAIEWPKEPAIIEGDRSQLDQLLRNLIDNALKYGDAHEPVTVTVERLDDHIALAVQDRGPGIGPEHLPHLTRRFYRTDPGRSRAAGGTGLGLAIVKHIVERHRGKLEITSRVGDGTTVSVRFEATHGEAD